MTDFELPHQTHSRSSGRGAHRPSAARIVAQERWAYETLQRCTGPGLSDWQLWILAEPTGLFDKLSSMRRARIGLVWISRRIGATPYHPIENSGAEILNPETGVLCSVWWMKPLFREMPYEQWVEKYKALARERH